MLYNLVIDSVSIFLYACLSSGSGYTNLYENMVINVDSPTSAHTDAIKCPFPMFQ